MLPRHLAVDHFHRRAILLPDQFLRLGRIVRISLNPSDVPPEPDFDLVFHSGFPLCKDGLEQMLGQFRGFVFGSENGDDLFYV